jgi:hypothetical protein
VGWRGLPYLHLQSAPVQAEHITQGAELGRVAPRAGQLAAISISKSVTFATGSAVWGGNIYGPGDQRASRHLRENWEDPVTFLAPLEREHPTA